MIINLIKLQIKLQNQLTQMNNLQEKNEVKYYDPDLTNAVVQNVTPNVQEVVVQNPTVVTFQGNPTQFNRFITSLNNPQLHDKDQLDIKITGVNHQFQNIDKQPPGIGTCLLACCCCNQACAQTCACCVCFFSCILLLLFWWIILPVTYCCAKRAVEKLAKTVIDQDSYDKMVEFSVRTNHRFRKCSLKVQDNHFNPLKVQCLRAFLQHTGVSQFHFENEAMPMDCQDNEWSNFTENIRVITSLPGVRSTFKWHNKLSQN